MLTGVFLKLSQKRILEPKIFLFVDHKDDESLYHSQFFFKIFVCRTDSILFVQSVHKFIIRRKLNKLAGSIGGIKIIFKGRELFSSPASCFQLSFSSHFTVFASFVATLV